jgi:hypothetical protein
MFYRHFRYNKHTNSRNSEITSTQQGKDSIQQSRTRISANEVQNKIMDVEDTKETATTGVNVQLVSEV